MLLEIFYVAFGGFILSLLHASIPNHWVPILAFAKANSWSKAFMNLSSVITAFFHSLSTIIVGTLIGVVGIFMWQRYELVSKLLASGVFLIMGLIYVSLHIFNTSKHHHHHGKEFHLVHSHKVGIVAVLFLLTLLIGLSIYFVFSANGNKAIFFTLLMISVLSLIVVLIVLWINSRKHFFSYEYHIHGDNDSSSYMDDNHYHHEHFHEHVEHEHVENEHVKHEHIKHEHIKSNVRKVGNITALAGLSLALFLSPCTEIEIFYLQAAKLGVYGIVLLSLTYLFTTIFVTIILVNLGNLAIEKFNLRKLEHNEDMITGVVMIALSLLFFVL